MSRQVEKAGVKFELGIRADAETIARRNADVVILATGSRLRLPDIPGIERPHVLTTLDLFEGRKTVGSRVLVIGGGSCGCEAAAYLAAEGRQAIIVEMAPKSVVPEGKTVNTKLAVKALLATHGIEVMTGTRLVEITSNGAIVERGGSTQELLADSVVIATGFEADTSLRDALEARGTEVVTIGDCAHPRTIGEAIWEGFHAARVLH